MLQVEIFQKSNYLAACAKSLYKLQIGKYSSLRHYSSHANENSCLNKSKPQWIPYSHANIGIFFQEKPRLHHPFLTDNFLQRILGYTLPKEVIHSRSF